MGNFLSHYKDLLAEHYNWAFGGIEDNVGKNRAFFQTKNIVPRGNGKALDLGAGTGFQSLALAQLGFTVTAVDLSELLLEELRLNSDGLPIRIVHGDLLLIDRLATERVELAVCMGDTLNHFPAEYDVRSFLKKVHGLLEDGGRLVLGFRDLSRELTGTERFIPVKSDDERIFTCFLEYADGHVTVNDIIYEKRGGRWEMRKSSYRKLRFSPAALEGWLRDAGFIVREREETNGMVVILAEKG